MPEEERQEMEQATVAAHQIKSPLGTVQTIIRTLLGGYAGELSDKQVKFLRSADSKCSEALATVRDLLALAELTGSGACDTVADLASALHEAHDRFREPAAEKDLDVAVEVAMGEACVNAEPAVLLQAVSALLDNAVRYTPEGGRVRVELGPTDEGNVRLRVADSGIGLPEDETEQLFLPFYRADNAREVLTGGTGLGLSFVQAVARAAGGNVSAGASEMGGAEFRLSLPLVPCPVDLGAGSDEEGEPSMRVVVIGGVAAGPKVAAKVMRLKPDAHVTIVEKGRVLSYAGCGLPYYISGKVEDQRELISTPEGLARGPDYFGKIKRVQVMNRTEAIKIDTEGHSVLVKDLLTGDQQWLPYDKLALAVGALPIVPDIPGVHLDNVFTLHGLQHAEGIKAELAAGGAKDVTIFGGGLIGVEMTESLVVAGCRATLLEMRSQLLPNILDLELAELLRRHFEARGVRVLLDTKVTGFEGDTRVRRVVTEESVFPADMVIMGVGVRPNVELAEETGLNLGPTGAIEVDQHMRTSDPDIYAAGDCAEDTDLLTGEPCYVPLGSTAAKQGRVAAVNICGGDDVFPGVMRTTVCKVFDYTVARTGLTEKQASEAGCDVMTTLTPGYDRGHFMPEARMIIVKLIADRATRKLVGVQAVGPGEAAKRVDVAVTAMTAGLTVDQIANLDLCYAPSYSKALDNLHVACNVMRNKLDGHMRGVSPMTVRRMRDEGKDFVLLDVRTHDEFEQARLEDAVHIPLSVLRARLAELPRDRPIVTFSRVSLSAYEAAIILRSRGFEDVRVMDGGILMWPYGNPGE